MDVEPYVEASSLWLHVPDGTDREVVPEGELTLDRLVELRDAPFGSIFYLRFIQPLDLSESAAALAGERELARRQQSEFKAGVGRLARGGLLPRLGDGLFSLSLILRGTVPGATAAAAALKYAGLRERDGRFVYHGRVIRQSGWTICQYWFFFAYNPWRSGFHGVNDHESDWEMISVYLYEGENGMTPEWVAYASHDFHGADLRRRFDDPVDLELVDGHPVVYAGAGSHASYFRPGEYQAEMPIPAPRQVRRLAEALAKVWRERLGQGDDTRRPAADSLRRLRPRRRPGHRAGTRQLLDAEPDRREDALGQQVPRSLGPLCARSDLGRERAGRPDVRPQRHAPPVLVRSPRLRGSRPGHAAATGAARCAGRAGAARPTGDRARPGDRRVNRGPAPGRRATRQHAGKPAPREHGGGARARGLGAGREPDEPSPREVRERRRRRGAAPPDRDARVGGLDDPRAHIRRTVAPVPESRLRFNHAAEVWATISISLLLVGLAILLVVSPGNAWAEGIVARHGRRSSASRSCGGRSSGRSTGSASSWR